MLSIGQQRARDVWRKLRKNVIFIMSFFIFLFFAITLYDKGFLKANNLLNIFRQSAMISVMAVATAFLLGAGQIDLSIGSIVGLSGLVSALTLRTYGLVPGIMAGLMVGLAFGCVNAFLVVTIKIPAFLVTIATMGIANGIARWATNLKAVSVRNDMFTAFFGSGSVGPVPSLFIWTIVIVTIGHLALKKSTFGIRVLSVGVNEDAAVYAGIKTNRLKYIVFILSSLSAALAGLLYAGRLHAAKYNYGEYDLMIVIAAVVIGGNSIYGGKATVIGALIGSLILGVINNALIIQGLSVEQQIIFRGVLIVLAVALGKED